MRTEGQKARRGGRGGRPAGGMRRHERVEGGGGAGVTRHQVRAAGTLLECLERMFPGAAHRTLRQFLAHHRVRVNRAPAQIEKMLLRPGDVVEVGPPGPRRAVPQGIAILHEDRDIIVIAKREDLLTMATPKERDRTAYAILFDTVRHQRAGDRVFIVHRIDRRTSGVLVFARSEAAKQKLQEQFRAQTVDRKYLAIVEGTLQPPRGTFQSYLVEDAHLRVRATTDKTRGKLAVTHYRVLRHGPRHSVLEVTLGTGRKGQIRVHLADAGHPIVGDREYGSGTNPLRRLGLHAHRLAFTHPGTGRRVTFEAPIPAVFRRFLAAGDSAARSEEGGVGPRRRAGGGAGGEGPI